MSYRIFHKSLLSACVLISMLLASFVQAQQAPVRKNVMEETPLSVKDVGVLPWSPDMNMDAVGFVDPLRGTYPDPKMVGVPQPHFHALPPSPGNRDRYAKISEAERIQRIWEEQCRQNCSENAVCVNQEPCPLCELDPKTPCGTCKMCVAGFPCEKTLCRHCIQQRSQNMCNSCDLTAGDEPCGTCDACREHRSDPCEHADDGHGKYGEFNPYKERRLFSVIPRPILDAFNNNARKFPVYYNPAPYYRPHWNPSLYAGYARPYTFRWSCPLCYKDPCRCNQPGFSGQVPYAFSCKFCNRNPCACSGEICNVNKEMTPKGASNKTANANAAKDATAMPPSTSPSPSPSPDKMPAREAGTRTPESEKPVPPTTPKETEPSTVPSTESLLEDENLPSLRDAPNPSRDRRPLIQEVPAS